MNEFDDLNEYNGHPEHDMWVDYTRHENIGDLDDYFDEEEYDDEGDY